MKQAWNNSFRKVKLIAEDVQIKHASAENYNRYESIMPLSCNWGISSKNYTIISWNVKKWLLCLEFVCKYFETISFDVFLLNKNTTAVLPSDDFEDVVIMFWTCKRYNRDRLRPLNVTHKTICSTSGSSEFLKQMIYYIRIWTSLNNKFFSGRILLPLYSHSVGAVLK